LKDEDHIGDGALLLVAGEGIFLLLLALHFLLLFLLEFSDDKYVVGGVEAGGGSGGQAGGVDDVPATKADAASILVV
jgi:hypothetical protein